MIDGFVERLEGFIKEWEDKVRPVFERELTNLTFEGMTWTKGRKYAKLVHNRSVVAFVDMNNGDIYKPAGWSKPAKHVRGNIFSKDGGFEAVVLGGFTFCVRYLK